MVAKPWMRVDPGGGVMVTACVQSKPLVTSPEMDAFPTTLWGVTLLLSAAVMT